jgi:uncharacterized protein
MPYGPIAPSSERGGTGDNQDAAILVQPRTIPRVVTDDLDDDHVIAAAVESRAACVVTGDQAHLLPIGVHKGIAIVSPRQCLAMLDR